jgi:hypothetical protein
MLFVKEAINFNFALHERRKYSSKEAVISRKLQKPCV